MEWCYDACLCLTESEEETYTNETPAGQAQTQESEDEDVDPVAYRAGDRPGVGGGGTIQSIPGSPGSAANPGTAGEACFGNNTCQPLCMTGSCQLGSQCSGEHCLCQAKSATYVPNTGILEFTAGCTFITSVAGKRSEPMPCPCNSTYVSLGCCHSDGMIWEAPELKLGELQKEL